MNEPDYINELGVKWWRDNILTEYAQSYDRYGIRLDLCCLIVETPDKYRTRLLVDRSSTILADNPSMDAIATKIDMLKFLKR